MLPKALTLTALLGAVLAAGPAAAAPFEIEEAGSAGLGLERLRPGIILIDDLKGRQDVDPVTGLIRFEDWARAMPQQQRALSLHESYVEPTIQVNVHGITKPYKEKLHVYMVTARFLLDRPAGALDVAEFASLPFLERIDPSIEHKQIAPQAAAPLTDPDAAHNRNPERPWCEAEGQVICIESVYRLEGKLPLGIKLANKLEDSAKKIPETLEFQSELRVLPEAEIGRRALGELTGIASPVTGAVEQTIFYVNQMMQFGRFLAVLQEHPQDAGQTVVTAFVALGIETDVLEKKKEFERVPVLRNMVPAQVLMGQSSFNTGTSISAGLPAYVRHRMRAVADAIAGD